MKTDGEKIMNRNYLIAEIEMRLAGAQGYEVLYRIVHIAALDKITKWQEEFVYMNIDFVCNDNLTPDERVRYMLSELHEELWF